MKIIRDVQIVGCFGADYLRTLFGACIGPSPTIYRMTATLIRENADGSALCENYTRAGDGQWYFHADGSPCLSYPCNHGGQTHRARVYYCKLQRATVPAGCWERLDVPHEARYEFAGSQTNELVQVGYKLAL